MSTNQDQPERLSPNEIRRINEACNGAPRLFSYPAPLPISDEERKRYEEISASIPTPKRKPRRRR